MKKSRRYDRAYFSAEVLKEAYRAFEKRASEEDAPPNHFLTVGTEDEEWRHDSEEEFLSDYRRGGKTAFYDWDIGPKYGLTVMADPRKGTKVDVKAPTRPDVEAVFDVFETHLLESTMPQPEIEVVKPKIFVGHGRSTQWRDLKDHLHDQHGYEVVAYEVGARAGHTIRDILEDMLGRSSFAILILSAEDQDADGKFHARPNVIHELGLFQGRLGFSRAVALLEEGTEEFSNIHGIQQIRYGRNNIKETFGEILATLRREFEANGK